MGSVEFDAEDDSLPGAAECNRYKLQKKLLSDSVAVNHALVPKKLRSATKKRGRKSIVSPLPSPQKRHHAFNGVEDGAKRSRLNMKQGHVITKDEEEVAETLYALADMLSDIAKTSMPVLDSEPVEIRSSNVVEAESSITVAEDSKILTPQEESRKINTKAEVVKFQSLDDTEKSKLPFSKQSFPALPTVQPDLSLGPTPEPNMPTPRPKKSWKSASTHVHIACLIKDLQKSSREEGLLHNPTRLATNGGMTQRPYMSIPNQNGEGKGEHGDLPFNGFTHSASENDSAEIVFPILSHERLLQDQHQGSKTHVLCSLLKQGSDFLSLAAGGYGSDASEQFHFSYEQPQRHSAVFLSLSHNGYSSTLHNRSSSAAAQVLPYTCNSAGFAAPHLQDWQNGGRDAQALFPHLHSVLSSKYHRFSPQQRQLMPVNSSFLHSDVQRHDHRLNPTFEGNRTGLRSDNILPLQLLCHQNL